MKRIISTVLIFALILCGVCSCGGNDSGAPDYPAQYGGVTLGSKPESVVSLSPAVTSVIFDLGFEDSLVGVSNHCRAGGIPRVGTVSAPDIDALSRLSPDILLCQSPLYPDDSDKITSMGIAVVVITGAARLDEFAALYEAVGLILGGANHGVNAGRDKYSELEGGLESLRAAYSQSKTVTVRCIVSSAADAPADSLLGDVLALLNAETAGGDAPPDFILCPKSMSGEIDAQDGKVVEYDPDLFYLGGSLYDAAVELAAALHSDIDYTEPTTVSE